MTSRVTPACARALVIPPASGLTQFGVNLLRLPPSAWSAQRHWHANEDEFIWVLSGEVVLVTDAGEETLRASDCAGFKAGEPDGHHLQNRSDADATVLEIGTRHPGGDTGYASDCDLIGLPNGTYSRRDGTPYPEQPLRSG